MDCTVSFLGGRGRRNWWWIANSIYFVLCTSNIYIKSENPHKLCAHVHIWIVFRWSDANTVRWRSLKEYWQEDQTKVSDKQIKHQTPYLPTSLVSLPSDVHNTPRHCNKVPSQNFPTIQEGSHGCTALWGSLPKKWQGVRWDKSKVYHTFSISLSEVIKLGRKYSLGP